LERIADHCVTIARRAKHLNERPALPELALLEPPYRLAITIFRDSIRAFADADYELARTLKAKDREVVALTDDISERLLERATDCQVAWILSLLLALLSDRGSCYEYR
jgi:phosphate uptake regulator